MRTLLTGTLITTAAVLVACSAGAGADSAAERPAAPASGGRASARDTGESGFAGRAIFARAACIACHGQNGEGTETAPALGGHTPEQIRSQVRNPVGAMPRFGPEQLADSDLEELIEYIGTLESAHQHESEATGPARAHFQMAINAIEHDALEGAMHHLRHAIELTDDLDQKLDLEEIMEVLESGDAHTAQHELLELAGDLAEEEVPAQETLHLQLALAALRNGDVDQIDHHLTHFTEVSSGDELAAGEAALRQARSGDLHEAEDTVSDLLGEGHLDD